METEEQTIEEEFFVSGRFTCGEFSLPIRRWHELEGQTVHSNAPRTKPGDPVAISYFWTHEPIPSSTLKFVKRTGNKFAIHWEGTCSLIWDEPYKTNVPFLIQTEAVFRKIDIAAGSKDTDATTRERLSKYLDTADFVQQPMKETVQYIPVENRFGIIDPLLRWIFRCPDKKRWVSRATAYLNRAYKEMPYSEPIVYLLIVLAR